MRHTPFATTVRAAILLAGCSMAAQVALAAPAEDEVKTLVRRFTAAQSGFDAATLKTLTADNYIEISPLGEVDPREKMLSFYGKKDKPRPEIGVLAVSLELIQTCVVLSYGGEFHRVSLWRRRLWPCKIAG
jgi:hypothetical protein